MCAPDYYGIEYEINPWMNRSTQSTPKLAFEQWRMLRRILEERMNAAIVEIQPQPGLPDMVFTANGGLVWDDKFIVSNFRHEVRRGEAAHFEAWFGQRGFHVTRLPREIYFEGEGDVLRCGDTWFAGYHFRSDILAHQKLADIIGQEVLSLELTNEWFYHLDTCLCPLGNLSALYYPPAFDPYAQAVLENHFSKLIQVSDEEAARFACNAVVVGNSIAINDGCPETRKQLEGLGFTAYETPLSEFLKAGGSAKCLVLKIQ
jgi:N-dimethylarginine dimethylaminohydrolase